MRLIFSTFIVHSLECRPKLTPSSEPAATSMKELTLTTPYSCDLSPMPVPAHSNSWVCLWPSSRNLADVTDTMARIQFLADSLGLECIWSKCASSSALVFFSNPPRRLITCPSDTMKSIYHQTCSWKNKQKTNWPCPNSIWLWPCLLEGHLHYTSQRHLQEQAGHTCQS